MWKKGVRAAVVVGSVVIAACGAKTPAPSEADAGTADSGADAGRGGKAGSGGGAGAAGATTGTAGATTGSAGTGATAGAGGAAGTSGAAGATTGSGATGGAAGSGGGAGAAGTTAGTGGTGGAAGGGGATGGTTDGGAGTGGADPGDAGPGRYVTSPSHQKVSKIDILVMVDNSSSMADKHVILATAVPELIDRLSQQKCIDPVTGKVVGVAMNSSCALGVLDFAPVKDIHLGIVTSSIGSHGAFDVCNDDHDIARGRTDPHNNDQGRLVSRVDGGSAPTFLNKGFLFYNPSVTGAIADPSQVTALFTEMVKGVGQHGCGYEASLEAVYHFLIDPEPYLTISVDTSQGGYGRAILNGTDTQLLSQRADFLRRDSLVSIAIMTDENDCSIVDGGQGFYPLLPPVVGTGRSVLPRGTSKCLENPNDPCCFNCGLQTPPAACPSPASDAECLKGEPLATDDQPNIRCFNQKQRYGADFLYPVQRYIDGFTKRQVPNRAGQMVANPLFVDLTCKGTECPFLRDPSLVFVTGIVGVPWQDLAIDAGDLTAGYKTAKQLREGGVWANIVGDPLNPAGPIPPGDVHMIESIKPRQGLPGPGSAPAADPIHGHEWDPSKDLTVPNDDLQYACTFDLATPRVCTAAEDCDCFGPHVADTQSPLCQTAQGAYSTTQLRGKSYPGVRILQVLQGIGDQAVVGSICPAQNIDNARADFGYSPVVGALMSRLREPLGNPCLPIALSLDATTRQTACAIIEVFSTTACVCDSEPGRRTASAALLTDEIRAHGACRCEITQLSGAAQTICQSQKNPLPGSGDGWCYVDPAQSMEASCDIVQGCRAHEKRRIRFMNPNSEPRPGATVYLSCDAPPASPLPNRCP
jgi:hypothetical protein